MSVIPARFAVLWLLLLIQSTMGLAQTVSGAPPAPTQVSQVVVEQKAALEALARRTTELDRQADRDASNDASLAEIRVSLQAIEREVIAAGAAFRPRLAEINARLEQIGPPPGDGNPAEPEALTRERQALTAEKAEINAIIGEAEDLTIRINQLLDRVAQMRRDLFANTLYKRYDISTALNVDVLEDFLKELSSVYRSFSAWLRFVGNFKFHSALLAVFFSLAAAAVLVIGGRRMLGSLFRRDVAKTNPSYLKRVSVAFWSTLLPTLALTVFLTLTMFFLNYYAVLRGDIGEVLTATFNVVAMMFFTYRLLQAVLAPRMPNWRLVPVSDRAARLLLVLGWSTAVVTGLDFLMGRVNDVYGSPVTLTIAKSLIATVIVGINIVLIGLVKPFLEADGSPRRWPAPIRYGLFVLGGLTVAIAILGYIGLARFMSQQVVVNGALLATIYIGYLGGRAMSEEGAFARTAVGRRLEKTYSLEDSTLDQLGLAAGILVNIVIVAVGLPLMMRQWGFQWQDIGAYIYRGFSEISIGTVSFSLMGILTGILIFVLGFFLTRWFQSWIDGSVMARGRVDAGVRNSIRTAVGYAGIALAAVFGISTAGIDLSNLALIAGALSLGIGFGLQNVVSNFVSGLILLAERPFKAGDWIVAGNVSGTVRKISVRATEIETFQRQTVILPNSELINAAVGNWTHKNKLGRIEIRIGVGYGSDVHRVHALLMEIATSHPLVLKNPEPFVLFADFGASSIDFEMRVFLADITTGGRVQNDIRFAIADTFAREAIEIPFPQHDLHIRTDATARAMPAPAQAAPAPGPARRRRRREPDPDV